MSIKKRNSQLNEIAKKLFPTFLLVLVFSVLFLVFAFCYYNIFFPLKYVDEIKSLSNKYSIEPALIASMINAESSFNPQIVSNKGAVGLMQIMPNTAKYLVFRLNLREYNDLDLLDAKTNIEIGVAYINYLSQKFDDEFTILCAYNAGEGNVYNWLKDKTYSLDGIHLTATPFKQTNYYAQKVLRNKLIYEKLLK